MKVKNVLATVVALAATASFAACAPPSNDSGSGGGGGGGGSDAATATSAADLGGMDALVKAAQKEGQLNVIALPPDWANYGAIIKAFSDKYGIKVNSAQPDAASQDEINAAKQLKGRPTEPVVLDLFMVV
jgi:putative spermidine/putrescine transport system substrate-binding protein